MTTTNSTTFTAGGIIAVAIIFWITAQNATGQARKVVNLLLIVLLTSMVLLNWSKISPLILKGGAS